LCNQSISYEDQLTTNLSNPSLLVSEKLTTTANTSPLRSTSEDISNSRSDSEVISTTERRSTIWRQSLRRSTIGN